MLKKTVAHEYCACSGETEKMINYGLEFHHIGLAAKMPDKALLFLKGMGYVPGDTVLDELQNVNLIFCSHPVMPSIEIIFSTDTKGPLEAILKNSTEMIYHICFETQSLEKTLEEIKNDGIKMKMISAPKPAILFRNQKVSFYYILGFGIVEILER